LIVLSASTSSPRGTVAIALDGAIVARVAYDGGTSHAERIFTAIDGAMAQAGVARGDLTALACDVGPGSFTGVRVGVASLKGIAVALGLPVVGVGALEAMAFAAATDAGGRDVLAVVDARKGEVFAAAYDTSLSAGWGPEHVARADVGRLGEVATSRGALVVGEVVVELVGLAPPPGPRRAEVCTDAMDLPDAAAIAVLATSRLASLSAVDAARRFDAALLDISYVRAPDAKPLSEQR
jgi:tRNA threonylcarbamoyladenosine biosynthesis protein TsaB